jgi:4-diphosphocytidyl-2-C-methyl-D-erythritol kinase
VAEPPVSPAAGWRRARAKINLTLRVIGRRADGYHEIESLVAFAGLCDWLAFEPGRELSLEVSGPRAAEAGPLGANLVLRAARALSARIPALTLGCFRLTKHLPAAAGIGGGSADAAAALRALVDANGLDIEDARVQAAARETGADVLLCLSPRARMVAGIGDRLGPSVSLPRIFAVVANPRVAAPTPQVFAALGLAPGSVLAPAAQLSAPPALPESVSLDALCQGRNDLEPAALRVVPAIAGVLDRLSRLPGARLARMTGSGATCFALFDDRHSAAAGRRILAAEQPGWWVEATGLR